MIARDVLANLQKVSCKIRRCMGLGHHDDDCFYYHSWRNNVVIAFGTLSSLSTSDIVVNAYLQIWVFYWSQHVTCQCMYTYSSILLSTCDMTHSHVGHDSFNMSSSEYITFIHQQARCQFARGPPCTRVLLSPSPPSSLPTRWWRRILLQQRLFCGSLLSPTPTSLPTRSAHAHTCSRKLARTTAHLLL